MMPVAVAYPWLNRIRHKKIKKMQVGPVTTVTNSRCVIATLTSKGDPERVSAATYAEGMLKAQK